VASSKRKRGNKVGQVVQCGSRIDLMRLRMCLADPQQPSFRKRAFDAIQGARRRSHGDYGRAQECA